MAFHERITQTAAAPRSRAAPAAQDAPGIVAHYLELVWRNLRWIVLLTVLAGGLAALLAVYQLVANPVYRAAATVTVQPTDAELRFTQGFVRSSSFDSANVVTQSHMEYLQSREIAARVYAALAGDGGTVEPPVNPLKKMVSDFKLRLRSWYRWMNSGTFVPVEGPEAVIDTIQQSIEINMVESSFIMEIAAYWNDPETAARIANVLAQVYQQRTTEQAAATTAELMDFLSRQRDDVQARIADLLAQRNDLHAQYGIVDYAKERADLLGRLSDETSKLENDRAGLRTTRAKLEAFADQNTDRRRNGLSQVTEDELALARLHEVELQQSIVEREGIVGGLQAEIKRYAGFQAPLEELDTALQRQRERLDDVESRLLTVRMNQAESLGALRLIDSARAPLYPYSPEVVKQSVTGAAAGLVLALLLVLTRDFASDRPATRAALAEVSGAKVLGPVRLNGRRPKAAANQPYLNWAALDTDGEVLVLDLRDDARAEKVALEVMRHPPHSHAVSCGLLRHVHRAGFVPGDTAAVLVTLTRGEAAAGDLRDSLAVLRAAAPGAALAVAFVDGAA